MKIHAVFILVAWCMGLPTIMMQALVTVPQSTSYAMLTVYVVAFPFLLIIISTLAMLVAYHMERSRIQSAFDTAQKRSNQKLVKITVLITFGFIITCGPLIVLSIIFSFNPFILNSTILTTSHTLLKASGVLDVVIYSFFDKQFTNFMRLLLNKCLKFGSTVEIQTASSSLCVE